MVKHISKEGDIASSGDKSITATIDKAGHIEIFDEDAELGKEKPASAIESKSDIEMTGKL